MGEAINLKRYIEEITYDKSHEDIEAEVSEELSKLEIFEVVPSLPESNEINTHKIYFILNDVQEENDLYNIFAYVNGAWEQIDSENISIDESGFVTLDEVNYLIQGKADADHTHDTASANDDGFMSSEDFTKLSNIQTGATQNTASDSTPTSDTSDGSSGVSSDYSRADHSHPKSSLYAESGHTHDYSELTGNPVVNYEGDIDLSNYYNKNDVDDLFDSLSLKIDDDGVMQIVLTNDDNVYVGELYALKSEIPLAISDLTNDSDFIEKSSTNGLVKNDGTIDTNDYVSAVDLADYVQFDNLGSYLLKNQSSNKGKNVAVDSSSGDITFEEKNNHAHGNITSDGKLYVGNALRKGKVVVTNNDGTLTYTDTSIPTAPSDLANSVAYNNIKSGESSTVTLTDQAKINGAIDTKIGELTSFKFIEIADSKPTASANTMNKLYIVSEDNKVNVYYTKQTGNTYSMEKMDTDILDEYTVSWSSVTNKPTIDTAPANNNDHLITSKAVYDGLGGKLDKSQTSYKGQNVVVDSSSGEITFEAKNNHIHSSYLTSSDISGKADSSDFTTMTCTITYDDNTPDRTVDIYIVPQNNS